MVGGTTMEVCHIFLGKDIIQNKPITACIGYFDGLHKGHQALIKRVLQQAKQTDTIPALITFDPDPWTVIHKMEDISHITSMEDRMQIAKQMGIQMWIVIHFHEEMEALSIQRFHKEILNPLHIQTLVCGYDFHYAHKGEGNVQTLKQQTVFDVDVIDEISMQGEKISSSSIENLIMDGEMEKVEELLTRPYRMKGRVFLGRQVGRTIGFPTANLLLNYRYIYPKKGVYIGSVHVKGKWHKAIINIGNNPTLNYRQDISIEAHILDFHSDIYEEDVIFCFYKRLRGEKKFAHKEELVEQLQNDENKARHYFEERQDVLCD